MLPFADSDPPNEMDCAGQTTAAAMQLRLASQVELTETAVLPLALKFIRKLLSYAVRKLFEADAN